MPIKDMEMDTGAVDTEEGVTKEVDMEGVDTMVDIMVAEDMEGVDTMVGTMGVGVDTDSKGKPES